MSSSKREISAVGARERQSLEGPEQDVVDFKMVTFSLGGKDYGIDIMKVKEIAKFQGFTYVPNCPPYVRGVYNLRGDIISVIDLRRFFSIPVANEATPGQSNGLILRLPQTVLGVVVDSIDKVVGISSEAIQPPHPIFADINLKYISGVVEYADRLYIILDVERIFTAESENHAKNRAVADTTESSDRAPDMPAASGSHERNAAGRVGAVREGDGEGEISTQSEAEDPLSVRFVSETLAALSSFYVTDLNEHWVLGRADEWRDLRVRNGLEPLLRNAQDADEFLQTFFTAHTGTFWPEEYSGRFRRLLPAAARSFMVWNPGCAKGHESYSIAATLRRANQQARIKIWASDRDLLNIATAPNLVVPEEQLPVYLRSFCVKGRNGYSFGNEIKDLIVFEYHDIIHTNVVPEVDLIVARDVLSFLKPDAQTRVIGEFADKLVDGGLLVIGSNERLPEAAGWSQAAEGPLNAYRKSGSGTT